ncbi:MAG: hypothetical protein ABI318_16605 [Chthoniobacteraceae bacterium]
MKPAKAKAALESTIFKASPRATDGKIPWSDLLLEYLTTLVFQLPESGTVKGVTMTAKWKGSPTAALFYAATDFLGHRRGQPKTP